MDKPEYAIKIEIVDETTGETVVRGSTLLQQEKQSRSGLLGLTEYQEEAAEIEFWDVIRHFRKPGGLQDRYEEATYTPKEESDN